MTKYILPLLLILCVPLMADEKKGKEEFEKWKAQAEKGDALAQYNLGVMYRDGQGVEKDFKEAVEWFQKSANQGFAPAQYNLGVMYSDGEGVEKDSKEAAKWYRKAAEQGFGSAQKNLGVMYGFGNGVLQDYVTAYAWVNIAEANGADVKKFESEILEKKMTPEQIAEGQKLTKEMVKKNPKLLQKQK